jgi:hypothetical protein
MFGDGIGENPVADLPCDPVVPSGPDAVRVGRKINIEVVR